MFSVLVAIWLTAQCSQALQDVCILPSGARLYGARDCATGEIQLNGTYVNVGIHNVGSFGTTHAYVSPHYQGQLGIISDYNKDGFNGTATPTFAGDFIISSAGLEGFLTRYTISGSTKSGMNEGLLGQSTWTPTVFTVSSDDIMTSAMWVSVTADVEIRKVHYINKRDLHVSTSVTVKNVNSAAITNFYCKPSPCCCCCTCTSPSCRFADAGPGPGVPRLQRVRHLELRQIQSWHRGIH